MAFGGGNCFAEPDVTLSKILSDQILRTDQEITARDLGGFSSVPLATNDNEAYVLSHIWIRLAFDVEVKVPFLSLSAVPDVEMIYQKPLPGDWDWYTR